MKRIATFAASLLVMAQFALFAPNASAGHHEDKMYKADESDIVDTRLPPVSSRRLPQRCRPRAWSTR